MDTTSLIQRYFTAWQERDWQALETILTEDFTFTSPYDDRIAIPLYKQRCWDTVTQIGTYEIEAIETKDNAGFVTYVNTINGVPLHNTEFFRITDGKISSVHVYFGLPHQKAPITPNPQLAFLTPLVGTWDLKGRELNDGVEINGQLRFEWMEGGNFLLQHVDIYYGTEHFKGVHYIGYPRDWDGSQSKDCVSTFFDTLGNAYKYIWEFDGHKLHILHGDNGAYGEWNGTLSDDNKTLDAKITWDGGGYDALLIKQ